MPRPKIAICFFGILRDLDRTIGSIDDMIIGPARNRGEVSIHAHLYRLSRIQNPRSGESGLLSKDDGARLNPDRIMWEDPDLPAVMSRFATLREYGDWWGDDFTSLKNLCHQLHSLECVTDMALEEDPDLVIFARPDNLFHDSFARDIDRALRARANQVILPDWQHWGGLNDRFAIARGRRAALTYGNRGRRAVELCDLSGAPLHSERLVCHALKSDRIPVRLTSARATRVRSNGDTVNEDFVSERRRWCCRQVHRAQRITGLPIALARRWAGAR